MFHILRGPRRRRLSMRTRFSRRRRSTNMSPRSTGDNKVDEGLFSSFLSEIKSREKFHKKLPNGSIIINGNDPAGSKRMTKALAVEHFFAILPVCNHDYALASKETRLYLAKENCLYMWDDVRASIQARVAAPASPHIDQPEDGDTDRSS